MGDGSMQNANTLITEGRKQCSFLRTDSQDIHARISDPKMMNSNSLYNPLSLPCQGTQVVLSSQGLQGLMEGCCEIKLNLCLCCFSAQAVLWVAAQISPGTALSIHLKHLCVLRWCLVVLQTQSPHGPGTVSCWDRRISKAAVSDYTIHVQWHKLNVFHYPGTYTQRNYVKCSVSSQVFFVFKLPWLSSFNIFIVFPPSSFFESLE